MTRSNSSDESESVDEKRAQYERFQMTVCANGVVNVCNRSHNDDKNHTYSVEVGENGPTGCSCPHHVHRGATCKHMIAVENSPIVVSSATAVATTPEVATDGGNDNTGNLSTVDPYPDDEVVDDTPL